MLFRYVRSPDKHSPGSVSVGGLRNSSLTAAFLTRRRIDFAAWPHRLHYHWIAGAIADIDQARFIDYAPWCGWYDCKRRIQTFGR